MAVPTDPNLYELAGPGVEVTYSTTGLDGRPRFSFAEAGRTLNASGDEIGTAGTTLGTEVTVTLETIPDLRTVTLTLLVPEVNLADGAAAALETVLVETVLVETTLRTTIQGPRGVVGQVRSYRAVELHGTARQVDF